jgi:hypothetical protein
LSNAEVLKEAKKEIYQLVKDIPSLMNKQLDESYKELAGKYEVDAKREWKVQAVIRLLQHKYYEEHNIEIPEIVQENFNEFFSQPIPKKQKRKTAKKKEIVDRKILNEERNRLLETVAQVCREIVPDGSITIHPQFKYATIKSGKRVVMFIERKLRKIIAFMGGERGRKNHPKLDISIGIEDNKIKPALVKFIGKNLEDFSNIRDKRWEKCKSVLSQTIKCFEDKLKDFDSFHSHPTGRYSTFKKGRDVLVFITQDRAKGEVAFHPGGERENNPKLTTTIKVSQVQNISDVEDYIDKFLSTHYASYMNKKNESLSNKKLEMKKALEICKEAIKHDEIFHHPKNFFGLVKYKEKPIVMVKRNKKSGMYDVVAWVKKQKNNPHVVIDINGPEKELIKSISSLVENHIGVL